MGEPLGGLVIVGGTAFIIMLVWNRLWSLEGLGRFVLGSGSGIGATWLFATVLRPWLTGRTRRIAELRSKLEQQIRTGKALNEVVGEGGAIEDPAGMKLSPRVAKAIVVRQ